MRAAALAPAVLCATVLALALAPSGARAIPRFAARTGGECIQCHVSPGGGGVRNAYGRNVFERAWLPMFSRGAVPTLSLEPTDAELAALEREATSAEDDVATDFTGDLTDWLAVGADFRLAYIWIRPDDGPTPGAEPVVTSSFFPMQAYVYLDAALHENVRFALQLGPYAGFEAWGLFRVDRREDATLNLLVKAGYFYPTFGIREVEHQLYTREPIGLGNLDRDAGVEVTGYAGPLTLVVGVFNGTLSGATFDTFGTERRTFEKALWSRLSVRADLGWLRATVGASFGLNENLDQPSPMFVTNVSRFEPASLARGLNELKAGVFLTANVGPFTYLADLVMLRDNFYAQDVPTLMGYASYQELGWLVTQGLDVVLTFEFMDTNVELNGRTSLRGGLVVEFFPWPFTEMRAMVRRTESDLTATGGAWDVVLQTHLFL